MSAPDMSRRGLLAGLFASASAAVVAQAMPAPMIHMQSGGQIIDHLRARSVIHVWGDELDAFPDMTGRPIEFVFESARCMGFAQPFRRHRGKIELMRAGYRA